MLRISKAAAVAGKDDLTASSQGRQTCLSELMYLPEQFLVCEYGLLHSNGGPYLRFDFS
jgi:hypothetical protein